MTTSVATFLMLAAEYAHACRTDDWHALAGVLAEDVTLRCAPPGMPGGGTYEGRAATLFFLLAREHLLVRPLGSWELAALDGPMVDGATTHCLTVSRLAASELPGLQLVFELRVTAEEGSVLLIVEDWKAESCAALCGHLAEHGAARGAHVEAVDLGASEELALLTRAMERTERRVRSRNQIAAAKSASDLGEPMEVQCLCSWTAPDLPPLSLEYGLRYRFGPPGAAPDVQELWEPAERRRLDAYLRAHGSALRRRAAERRG